MKRYKSRSDLYLKNQRRTRRQNTTRTAISWKDNGPRAWYLLEWTIMLIDRSVAISEGIAKDG